MKIKAEIREATGKRVVKRLRDQGFYPAVIYGQGNVTQSIMLEKGLMDVFMKRHPVKTQLFSVEVGNKSSEVLVKEIKRSTSTNQIQHIDFYQISKNKALQVNVPVLFQHEEDAIGVTEGGVLDHVMTELAIKVLPKDLPESIAVNIQELSIGGMVHLSEVTLPKGVELQRPVSEDYDPVVVSIHAPKVVEEEPEEVNETDSAENVEEAEQEEGSSEGAEEQE